MDQYISMQNENSSEISDIETINRSPSHSFEDNLKYYSDIYEVLSKDQIKQEYEQLQKSNFVKNIIRSFYLFILESGDEIVIESMFENQQKGIIQIRKEFQTFTRQKKFNQSTLNSLINSKRFGKIFYYFLKYYIYDWVISRSVKDLKSHVIFITYLKKQLEQNIENQKFD
ncbi:hypothetical protein ABPG72_013708 [Tetrahymena utriculariae]